MKTETKLIGVRVLFILSIVAMGVLMYFIAIAYLAPELIGMPRGKKVLLERSRICLIAALIFYFFFTIYLNFLIEKFVARLEDGRLSLKEEPRKRRQQVFEESVTEERELMNLKNRREATFGLDSD